MRISISTPKLFWSVALSLVIPGGDILCRRDSGNGDKFFCAPDALRPPPRPTSSLGSRARRLPQMARRSIGCACIGPSLAPGPAAPAPLRPHARAYACRGTDPPRASHFPGGQRGAARCAGWGSAPVSTSQGARVGGGSGPQRHRAPSASKGLVEPRVPCPPSAASRHCTPWSRTSRTCGWTSASG